MGETLPSPQLVEDLSLVFTDASPLLPAWMWAVGATGLLILGAAVYWLLRKIRARKAAQRGGDTSGFAGPPEAWALRRLRALQARMEVLPEQPFALEVSEILRVFLEKRFALRAAHQSTEEFLLDLRDSAFLPAPQRLQLEEFLRSCDLVKFARRALQKERKRELLESAVRLVNESKTAAAPDASPGARAAGPQADESGRTAAPTSAV